MSHNKLCLPFSFSTFSLCIFGVQLLVDTTARTGEYCKWGCAAHFLKQPQVPVPGHLQLHLCISYFPVTNKSCYTASRRGICLPHSFTRGWLAPAERVGRGPGGGDGVPHVTARTEGGAAARPRAHPSGRGLCPPHHTVPSCTLSAVPFWLWPPKAACQPHIKCI